MKKIYVLISAGLMSISSGYVLAGAASTGDVPPAQIQKDQVPNSTENGNYLEPQPDENGATGNTKNKQNQKNTSKKGAKPTNIEKSKRLTEDPASGGTDVKQN